MKAGVRVFVRDYRNLLLMVPDAHFSLEESRLVALEHALRRGIQAEFEVEERELVSNLIGQGERRGIMLYEAAEGGAGVLGRLVEDAGAIQRVARKALEICHFDPDSGKDQKETDCPAACYDCLLSYTNQPEHRILDRHQARDVLLSLSHATSERSHSQRTYEEHYRWLRQMADLRSDLERKFVDYLYRNRLNLPDDTQQNLADYYACPDFYYDRTKAAVFCDGSVHDAPEQKARDAQVRADLAKLGYRVVVIRYDADMAAEVGKYPDIFGRAH